MLILLDIDGVMVPASSWKKPEFLNDGFPAFSYKATQSLQKIISITSADILLTTSHKSKYTLIEWKNIFNLRGIKVDKIECLSENTGSLNRKDEVLNWFNINGINDDFIIIDDDKSLNELPGFLKEKLILTSGLVGLTDAIAEEAIAILEKSKLKVLA